MKIRGIIIKFNNSNKFREQRDNSYNRESIDFLNSTPRKQKEKGNKIFNKNLFIGKNIKNEDNNSINLNMIDLNSKKSNEKLLEKDFDPMEIYSNLMKKFRVESDSSDNKDDIYDFNHLINKNIRFLEILAVL